MEVPQLPFRVQFKTHFRQSYNTGRLYIYIITININMLITSGIKYLYDGRLRVSKSYTQQYYNNKAKLTYQPV